MVTVFQAVVLGVVQGITEFLPISSTGHLILFQKLAGWQFDHALTFDIALHVGTLLALLVYFRRDWVDIILCAFGSPQRRDGQCRGPRWLLWGILIACVPAAAVGLLWEDKLEASLSSHALDRPVMLVIATAMVLLAVVLYAADRIGKKRRTLNEMNFIDWIVIGVAQAVALIPGVSRSGATISAGLFRNLNRDAAARFSFLLSTPVILGAAGIQLLDVMKTGIPAGERLPFIVGMASSAVVGYIVIAFLLSYVRKHNMNLFVWYRIVFGLIILGLLASGLI